MFVRAALVMLLTAMAASGQQPTDDRKTLYKHLQKQAGVLFDKRRETVADLKTPEMIQARQKQLREAFIQALGGFPAKTPLNPSVVGTIEGEGFRVEKILFESRPHHHVTANLFMPSGKGPFPGVLIPCGHSANGKAADAYQRAAQLLARHGIAALCYDPIGQGERLQLFDTEVGKSPVTGVSEHTMVGVPALLVGRSTASYRIWDGIRAMDYLASRPEIDTKRLGCTGNSGGGTLTSYLMALDDRIQVAAPSCYICSLEKLFDTIGPQDAEQNIPGQVAFGMEHADYLLMRAPRPTLIEVATYDFFNIDGAWKVYREASQIYSRLGHGEKVSLFEFEDKHGFSKPRREAALRWMQRWLQGKVTDSTEGDWAHYKDPELQVTRSGQVLADFKGKSVFHLTREASQDLAKARAGKKVGADDVRQVIRLGKIDDARPLAEFVKGSKTTNELGLNWVTFNLPTEPGLTIQGHLVPGPAAKRATVVVGDFEKPELAKIATQGSTLLALELRGTGAQAPGVAAKGPNWFGVDQKEAWLSQHLDRPLLGQRVHDLLQAIARLEPGASIRLIARGSAGPVALHAAALEPRIGSVEIEGGLVSWQSVVDSPTSLNQLANAVYGALKVYDLPDLGNLIGANRLTLRGTVDAMGRLVSPESVRQMYPQAKVE